MTQNVWLPIVTALIAAVGAPIAYRYTTREKDAAEVGVLIDQRWRSLFDELKSRLDAMETELENVRTELHKVRSSWAQWGVTMVSLLRRHAPGVEFPPPPEPFEMGHADDI